MWHTSAGDRTLEGAEAGLVREAIGWVLDMLEPQPHDPTDVWLFGVQAFDHLEFGQKLALLCQVGEALLRPDIPPPKLTALSEATVGVLYQGIRQCVQIEIDDDADGFEAKHWRRLVLAAVAAYSLTRSGRAGTWCLGLRSREPTNDAKGGQLEVGGVLRRRDGPALERCVRNRCAVRAELGFTTELQHQGVPLAKCPSCRNLTTILQPYSTTSRPTDAPPCHTG